MPKQESFMHVFKHSWQQIATASWKKYPNHELRPDLLTWDIVDRQLDPQTNILTVKRVLYADFISLPGWLRKVLEKNHINLKVMVSVEESQIDPVNKVMTLKTKNLSMPQIMECEEICTYTVSKENPEWTDFKQEVKLHSKIPFVEGFSIDRYKENAEKGKGIMEAAINQLKGTAVPTQ